MVRSLVSLKSLTDSNERLDGPLGGPQRSRNSSNSERCSCTCKATSTYSYEEKSKYNAHMIFTSYHELSLLLLVSQEVSWLVL